LKSRAEAIFRVTALKLLDGARRQTISVIIIII